MTSIKELDFQLIKAQLRDHLRTQEQFKDYDFDGSNLSILLDVLAYNTYQNNFYGNMLFSEMFLDSAQLRNSVVSHAKELNYLPRSIKAAKAIVTVNMTIPNTNDSEVLIPKGTKFTSVIQGQSFIFSTRRPYYAQRVSGTQRFEAKCIDIYQGFEVSERHYLTSTNLGVTITNEDVDTDTIAVSVAENSTPISYEHKRSIYSLGPTDRVFFVEIGVDGKYTIQFGGNKYGYQPLRSQELTLTYAISDGETANGASVFTTAELPGTVVTTISVAAGGSDRESLEEIRFNAPKSLQTQERAVTSSDYRSLLLQRFTQLAAVSVFGGDELEPPRYGKVAIAMNLNGNVLASDSFKSEVLDYLSDKVPVSIKPIFINPEFMYVHLDVKAYYNPNQTTTTDTDLKASIKKMIMQFNDTTDFGRSLQQSDISDYVTESNSAVKGASVILKPIIEFSPQLGIVQNLTLDFKTQLRQPYPFDSSKPNSAYTPAVKSSVFIYNGSEAIMHDDGLGNLKILSTNKQSTMILNQSAGVVDYELGRVRLSSLIFDGFEGNTIRLTASTEEQSIFSPKNRLLAIKESDINLTLKRTS